ncbi:glycosyl transferase [Roseivirga sp. E12]|uniref:glycosyl transferase n=1 Tax=Roseivirga sp. E12 TaxID=2819237 RepID=UPI001ABBF560|nr:glycosyl transferase [Roseivirga sp. E12]MBO3697995.1 glycosyl transferase [Roseivirga sp. E12]
MEEKRRPILIVTYYWPPSGGAGVQRWLKFTKYLTEFGWDPIIFTPENPDFDQRDSSLEKDINPAIEVLKFPIWEPYSLFKRLTGKKELKQGQILESKNTGWAKKISVWLRGNFFIPDPRIFWVKPASNYLLSILETNEIKHFITTGPPHSVHLIGKRLKLRNPALTWIADFRDPWSQWDILKQMHISSFVWKKHLKLEQEVLKVSDAILATGPTAANEFKALGARRAHFVTNGFDLEDVGEKKVEQPTTEFVVSHVGMLSKNRNPENLWSVLDELCEDQTFYEALNLKLTGILSTEVQDAISAYPRLKERLSTQDSIPHDKVYQEYLSSNLLLLVQTNDDGAASQLPGKLFEYLSAKRPVLAIGRQDNDISKIIQSCSAGESFQYDSRDELKAFIQGEFEDWKSGDSKWQFSNIERYERRNLAKDLSEWLLSL